MTSYLMVQAIWRICIIPAPHTLNYRESCAYQAVELRYELAALFQSSLLQPLPVLSLLPRGSSPYFPSPASPLTFNMKWSWHFIVYSPRLGHFSLGGRRNLWGWLLLTDKTQCSSRGRGLKRRSLNAACFVE